MKSKSAFPLVLFFLSLCLSPRLFAEGSEVQRLDNIETVKETIEGFTKLKKNAGWATKTALPGQKDSVYVCYEFPEAYYVTKISVKCTDVFIPDFAETTVPGVYSFEVMYRRPKAKSFTSVKKIVKNEKLTQKFELNEMAEAVKIVLLPVMSVKTKKQVCYAELADFGAYGYPGNPPPPEKPEIRNKKQAGEAVRNGDITSQEYMKYMKELKE